MSTTLSSADRDFKLEVVVIPVADVDRARVRLGVKKGLSYDLVLSRILRQASVVRGEDGVGVFCQQGLEAGGASGSPSVTSSPAIPGSA